MKRNSCFIVLLATPAAFAASISHAQGRGDYLNFESPQVEPVCLAQVGASDDPYLLVCNTPDNRVEVYDISSADSPVLERRILVGLEPVSVAFKSFSNGRDMLYTANWLGDSVTYVELFSSGGVLTYKMLGTFPVNHTTQVSFDAAQGHADEPVHVATADGGTDTTRWIFVAKRFGSSFAWMDAFTGAHVSFDPDGVSNPRSTVPGGGIDAIMTSAGLYPRDLDGTFTTGGVPQGKLALKEPQCIAISPTSTGRFWVLGQQGGGSKITFPSSGGQALPAFNLDLWTWDVSNLTLPPAVLPNPSNSVPDTNEDMGTTNFNAEFDSDGLLYVIGTEAQNDVAGDSALSSLPSGFAPTMLYRINVNAGNPGSSTVDARDLGSTGPPIGQATDIDVYEPVSGPNAGATFIIVAGFAGDRFARVRVTSNAGVPLAPAQWSVLSVPVPRIATGLEVAGPRGVAVNSVTQRGYFLNSIDNSIFVANLQNFQMGTPIALANDPLPTYMRRGKKFLYSNITSAIGMACCNCHIDGRSDQLLWRLSASETATFETTASGDPLGAQRGLELNRQFSPPPPLDGPDDDPDPDYLRFLPYPDTYDLFLQGLLTTGFPSTGGFQGVNPKGPMITQSLQGLSNFEVLADGDLDHYFSNAPYHWRGDKKTFLEFQGAFIDLQAQTGVTNDQMREYEEFINSVHYPPNAIEPITRRYSGALGTPNSLANGSGARRGLKLFHILENNDLFAGRTCAGCHAGSVSSDNRWTTVEAHPTTLPVDDRNAQPLNTAALRGLRQKEARLELNSITPPPLVTDPNFLQTGDHGMGHDGLRGFSINGFVGTTPVPADVVSQFIREFDTGVAPMVGRTITVFATDVTPQGGFVSGATWKADLVREMEHQAELANAGLAVHVFDDDGTGDGNPDDVELSRSFWYKVTELDALLQNPVPYKEENASTILSREGLLLLLGSADCATFTSTPLGSERRVASLSGDASVPSGSGTSIAQIGTTPNTANADAIGMTLQATLAWTETDPFNPPFRIRSQEIFRNALGLPAQHDFARRLRFTGVGLQEGGRVKIGIDMDSSDAPDASGDTDFQYITLPIHPTNAFQGANRIWETSVELEPLFLYMLLLGGPEGTGIDEIMTAPPATQPPPETFNPAQWNRYRLSYISPSNVSTTETVVALVY